MIRSSFRSACILSIHLNCGLPRRRLPSTSVRSSNCFAGWLSSHLSATPIVSLTVSLG
ncbi:hypothetical protein D918_09951, partial [Trichuris suis]